MDSEEVFRVIIIDDDAETRENIRKLLQFESDLEVVGAAKSGNEGIQVANESKPDVILMDINMPDMDGIEATELIRKDLPYVQIVILSVQNDPNYMRKAMLAGARDFLAKPPSVDELISAIRRAGQLAREERIKTQTVAKAQTSLQTSGTTTPALADGKVILVYSPKGGAGCTTVATNLAMLLQSEDSPVVLVDGNLQYGDVSVFLNEQSKNSIVDLTTRVELLDAEMIHGVLIHHSSSGVKILASPPKPEYSEGVTGEQFTKVIQYLQQLFTYVIIDTETSLNDITLAAMDACHVLILLVTQEIPAIKNARLFLDLADALGINRNRILMVMNRFDKKTGISPEKVSESFKHEVSGVLPLDDRVVTPSINRGVPFILGDKSRPISRSFYELTDSLRQILNGDGSKLIDNELVKIARK
ncbi:MAG: response regulator [Anaerolineales bacterium]|nr:response regulator [Anaerolineales bacterium]